MINFDATFGYDFLQVPIRDAVAHIEKHSEQDYVLGRVAPFETYPQVQKLVPTTI